MQIGCVGGCNQLAVVGLWDIGSGFLCCEVSSWVFEPLFFWYTSWTNNETKKKKKKRNWRKIVYIQPTTVCGKHLDYKQACGLQVPRTNRTCDGVVCWMCWNLNTRDSHTTRTRGMGGGKTRAAGVRWNRNTCYRGK